MAASRVRSTFPQPKVEPAPGDGWPEGVVARYLTVGGATVDLTVRTTLPPDPEPFATLAACTGCPDSLESSHTRTGYSFYGSGSTQWEDPEAADAEARSWAQSHAEKCRAMPRPEGGGR